MGEIVNLLHTAIQICIALLLSVSKKYHIILYIVPAVLSVLSTSSICIISGTPIRYKEVETSIH